jgi:hypothetical protein
MDIIPEEESVFSHEEAVLLSWSSLLPIVLDGAYTYVGPGWCRSVARLGFETDGHVNGRVKDGVASAMDCRTACSALNMCEGFAWGGDDSGRCYLHGPGLDHRLPLFHEETAAVVIGDAEWASVSRQYDPSFTGIWITSTSGDEGAACFRRGVVDVRVREGHYRRDNTSTTVVSCPVASACKGSEGVAGVAGDDLCSEGHSGPMCQVCTMVSGSTVADVDGSSEVPGGLVALGGDGSSKSTMWAKSGRGCVQCDGPEGSIRLYVFFAILAVAVLAAMLYILRRTAAATTRRRWGGFLALWGGKSQTKFKIVTNFFQVLTKVATVYPVFLPPAFTAFWAHFGAAALDPGALPVSCLVAHDFHGRLLVVTLLPFAFIAVVGLMYMLQAKLVRMSHRRTTQVISGRAIPSEQLRRELAVLQAKCLRVCLLMLVTMYPLVTGTIFQTFLYDERLGDGAAYLVADYTITQSNDTHATYVAYAVGMAVVHCLGVPLAAGLTLRHNKVAVQVLKYPYSRLI